MKMFILLILVSGSVYADIFKCKDKTGHLSYSERPCPVKSNTEEFDLITPPPITINNRDQPKTAKTEKEMEKLKAEAENKSAQRISAPARVQTRREFNSPTKSVKKRQRIPNTKLGYKHTGVRIRK